MGTNRISLYGIIPKLAVLPLLLLTGCEEEEKYFLGYAEGEYVYIASPMAGRLDSLMVQRGQTIEAGTPLFSLESENEAAAVRQATAQLEDLKTGKRKAEMDVLRAQLAQAIEAERLSAIQLVRDEQQYKVGAISKNALDTSRTTHKRDKAHVNELRGQVDTGELPARDEQIHAAEAALAQAQWKLDQKSVKTSEGGFVFDTMFVQGEWVPAGNPIVSVLPPANLKVRFFIPEVEVGKLQIGKSVIIHCDGCAQDIHAHITYISPQSEYTPPVIYSNATRNKLVFMIEARSKQEDATLLHPGQPVEVRLDEQP